MPKQQTSEGVKAVTAAAEAEGSTVTTEPSEGEGTIVRVEQAEGVYRETVVLDNVVTGNAPLADGPTAITSAPRGVVMPRETIAAEPPTEQIVLNRRPVYDREREAPVVRAATASTQANLHIALLREGDRVIAPVECYDIYDPSRIYELQAGAVVPAGKIFLPRHQVAEHLLEQVDGAR